MYILALLDLPEKFCCSKYGNIVSDESNVINEISDGRQQDTDSESEFVVAWSGLVWSIAQ